MGGGYGRTNHHRGLRVSVTIWLAETRHGGQKPEVKDHFRSLRKMPSKARKTTLGTTQKIMLMWKITFIIKLMYKT